MRAVRRPRVALVGVGRFGRNHLRVLRTLHRAGGIEFAGVIGRNARRARQLGARYGVRAYPSLDQALDDGLDVVDLATPAATHATLVRRCLPSAHVFVEKPLALTVSECVALYRLARRHSRLLGVGHIFRFNDAVTRVKAMLRHRRPYQIRIALTGWAPPASDVGALVTYLHVFDLLDELVGDPPRTTTCLARGAGRRDSRERYAVVFLEYAAGLSALVEAGWIGGPRRRVLEISFPRMQIWCDLLRQTVELHRPTGPVRTLRLYRREPLRLELEHFFACLRRGGGLRPAPAAVLRVMRMVRDAKTSGRQGRKVRWQG